ncbi:glutathione S-transferase C-terminal domain-containing protein [Strongylocentrotus purpuratus]|uniref:Methyltransferase domain-containing protein n=1 Tax=Strongylocentrotus purpuratus TaxID=7668 RepID=A0A7M7NH08_STRPU|nr:glutathione S-transferase C-terminal domain-containing protein [Strongylocentrotus purpuratus]XP_030836329.1 glutathione S-transferase C-terminal domain-containing protein [Strongylocentrotus purpuratus]XP_030836330.1 glutathione S-transferase C-terminal domain-containing protein [Strongylocentrotus purpuratus]
MEMDTKPTEDMLRDTLYLESSGDTSHVTLPSLIVIFLQQYCHYHNLDVILVCGSELNQEAKDSSKAPLKSHLDLGHEGKVEHKDTNISTSDDNLDSNSIRSDDVGLNLLETPKSIEYRVLKHVCLPRVVQDCQLPCILLPGRQLCVSGLANVLRHIIQAAVPLEPHRNLETLLGFRQTCLRCCSETSIWTKLCEVDTPQEVTNFLKNPSEVSSCPLFLNKFQEILSQPVSTHNSEKLRRKLLKSKKMNGNSIQGGGESNVKRNTDDAGKLDEREKGKDKKGSGTENSRMPKPLDDPATLCEDNSKELTSEFQSKMNLGNKKEIRRRKREQNRENAAIDQSLLGNDITAETKAEQTSTDVPNGAIDRVETNANGEMSSQPEGGNQRRRKKTKNKKKIHKDSLPELTHLFAHGVDVTLADFALFIPIHLWLRTSSLNGTAHNARRTVPLVFEWYRRMWDVPSVRQVASTSLGLREVDITPLKETSGDDAAAVRENSKTDSYLLEEDVRPHVGSLGVSRGVVRERLKKVLPDVILTLEDQGLSAGFMDHPSKDTTLDWRNMDPVVSPIEGEVEARRARGKEQQLESIVTAVQQIAQPGSRILDFCSGGGHLGIALAYCLPDCHVIMIENKEESLKRALGRVQTLGLQNVTLYLSNIDYFYGQFDIGVSLHACGVATDIVLSKCVEQGASFVSSPCCYGSLHNTHHLTYPRSKVFRESNISKKNYFLVAHAADQTCWDFDSNLSKQGKRCMGYIDRDRAELAREQGYHVTICSLKPETCSPKNNLLIGVSPHK